MERFLCICDVRGRGMISGIDIVADRQTQEPNPDAARRASERAYELEISANLGTHVSLGGTFLLLRQSLPLMVKVRRVLRSWKRRSRADGTLDLV
jgi:4-aminobutyrate aminotransferase-like enzyme